MYKFVIYKMADAETKFEQRHQQTSGLMEYANELSDMLESGKSVLSAGDVRKLADTTSKIVDKIEKTKGTTLATLKLLAENALQVEKNNKGMQDDLFDRLKVDTMDSSAVREKIALLMQEVQKRENDYEELKREHKRIENSKVHRRLQKAIVNVNFDLLSTEQNVRGYFKGVGSGNDLSVFDIDYSKEDPCDVTDRLWDMAH